MSASNDDLVTDILSGPCSCDSADQNAQTSVRAAWDARTQTGFRPDSGVPRRRGHGLGESTSMVSRSSRGETARPDP